MFALIGSGDFGLLGSLGPRSPGNLAGAGDLGLLGSFAPRSPGSLILPPLPYTEDIALWRFGLAYESRFVESFGLLAAPGGEVGGEFGGEASEVLDCEAKVEVSAWVVGVVALVAEEGSADDVGGASSFWSSGSLFAGATFSDSSDMMDDDFGDCDCEVLICSAR